MDSLHHLCQFQYFVVALLQMVFHLFEAVFKPLDLLALVVIFVIVAVIIFALGGLVGLLGLCPASVTPA